MVCTLKRFIEILIIYFVEPVNIDTVVGVGWLAIQCSSNNFLYREICVVSLLVQTQIHLFFSIYISTPVMISLIILKFFNIIKTYVDKIVISI